MREGEGPRTNPLACAHVCRHLRGPGGGSALHVCRAGAVRLRDATGSSFCNLL